MSFQALHSICQVHSMSAVGNGFVMEPWDALFF